MLKHVVALADSALRLLDPNYSTRRYQTLNVRAVPPNPFPSAFVAQVVLRGFCIEMVALASLRVATMHDH